MCEGGCLYCTVLYPAPPPLACVLPTVCRYNEKADVYSYGILVWFVAQYLHLCYNPHLWSDRKEFMTLMRPYDKGEATPVDALECDHVFALACTRVVPRHYRLLIGATSQSIWDSLKMPILRELSGWARVPWVRRGGGGVMGGAASRVTCRCHR
jgi:hypothetical protein